MRTLACLAVLVVSVSAAADAGQVQRGPAKPMLARPSLTTAQPMLPGGARVQWDPHDCVDNRVPCPTDRNPVYVSPTQSSHDFFVWNVERVPGASAARWQVIYTPLRADALAAMPEPGGVVRSGVQGGQQNEIELDLRTLARQLGMAPVEPPSRGPTRLRLPPVNPSGTARRVPPQARADRGAAVPPSHLFVRVVPVRSTTDPVPVGRPSDVIRIVYGDEPPLTFNLTTYTRPGPSIAITKFTWIPELDIDNWPSGCEPIPRDMGRGGLSAVGSALGDIWSWASTAYADIQSAVVDVAHTILPMVPRSVLNIALQSAMAAAGLPPNIPNLDQLMNDGADYLAASVAAEIPVPASDQLAGMAVDAFKAKAQDAARQAVLAGARKARQELSGAGVQYCRQWWRWPSFEITVRNTGSEDDRDVAIQVSDSAALFKNLGFTIPLIRRGQSMTVPVTLIDRSRMNVQVTEHSQLPEYDDDKAEAEWWTRAQRVRTRFEVKYASYYTCTDAAQTDCTAGPSQIGLESPDKIWVVEGYEHRTR